MEPRIPLPTDNIYKFYALFGLVVLLTTAIMFFIRHEHYNSMAFDMYVPLEILKEKTTLTEEEKKTLFFLKKKSEINQSNRDFELGIYLFCFFIFGGGLTIYGFYHWHTRIQPTQDKLLKLQIQKAERELRSTQRRN
jgi:tRNA(Leu) C34 or U34 (ribose-2'-O)-methylase TrmL